MTPTQEDHEAAARLHMSIASAAHAYYADHGEPCQGCIFIAAALSEAVRVAVEKDRDRIARMVRRELDAVMNLDIAIRTDAQATPAPEPIHTREGRGECDACSDESADDAGFRGTPPETGEKEPSR